MTSKIKKLGQNVAITKIALKQSDKPDFIQNQTVLNHEIMVVGQEIRDHCGGLNANEEKIRRQNHVLNSLHNIALGLMNRLDVNELLREIIKRASELMDTPHGFIALINKERNVLEYKVRVGNYQQININQIIKGQSLMGKVWETGKRIAVPDWPNWQGYVADYPWIKSVIDFPLQSDGHVTGVLGISFDYYREFNDDDIFALTQFVEMASIALENAKLHTAVQQELIERREAERQLFEANHKLTALNQELIAAEEEIRGQFEELSDHDEKIRRQNHVLNSLHDISLGMMNHLDLHELLQEIVKRAGELMNTPHGFISLVDSERDVLEYKVRIGGYKQVKIKQVVKGAALMGTVWETGKLIAVDDWLNWQGYVEGYSWLKSVIGLPLKSDGNVIGVLGIGFDYHREFNENDTFALTYFAEIASVALENAKLYSAQQQELLSRQRAELAAQRSEQRNRAILDALPDWMFRMDKEKMIIDFKIPKPYEESTYQDTVIGKNVLDFFQDNTRLQIAAAIETTLKSHEPQNIEYTFWHNGKQTHWESRIVDCGNEEVLAIMRDITEKEEMLQRLEFLSLHDSLTGLHNRTHFEQEMHKLNDSQFSPLGIIICDIDGLKLINDTLGHDSGDAMLIAAAQVIKRPFRSTDIVARIGGDEFAILLPNSNPRFLDVACKRIRESETAFNATNPKLPLSISVGFAIGDPTNVNTVQLFEAADNNMYREKLHRSQSTRSVIVQALVKALEARDFVTQGHADRLQDLVELMAHQLGLPENRIVELRLLAQFHDIGKVGIPDRILFKPGPLTSDEFTEMQRHCEIGYRIAKSIPDLLPIADWIMRHHEWWNGNGYPLKIKQEEIPLECRIVNLCDAFDAMTNDRPYHKAMSKEQAINEIKKCAGEQFDPFLSTEFIMALQRVH